MLVIREKSLVWCGVIIIVKEDLSAWTYVDCCTYVPEFSGLVMV